MLLFQPVCPICNPKRTGSKIQAPFACWMKSACVCPVPPRNRTYRNAQSPTTKNRARRKRARAQRAEPDARRRGGKCAEKTQRAAREGPGGMTRGRSAWGKVRNSAPRCNRRSGTRGRSAEKQVRGKRSAPAPRKASAEREAAAREERGARKNSAPALEGRSGTGPQRGEQDARKKNNAPRTKDQANSKAAARRQN